MAAATHPTEPDSRHQCLIYDGAPSHLLPAIGAMIRRKLDEGYRCLYLNSPSMVAGMRSCIAGLGVDVARELAKNSLILSTDSSPTKYGIFDVDGMLNGLESALDQALTDGYKGLWATGDMTWEFGAEKNFTKLFEYECRLEKLFWRRPELGGICQYHRDTLPAEAARQALLTHQMVFVNETLSRINPHYTLVASGDRPSQKPCAELDALVHELCEAQKAK